MPSISAEQQIRDLIDTWMLATAHGDLEQILSLMEEDVVFLIPGLPPVHGREEFAAMFRSMPTHARIDGTSNIREIQISGNLAYAWTQLSVTVSPEDDGETIISAGSTLSIYRKDGDDRWRLFRDANMLTRVTS